MRITFITFIAIASIIIAAAHGGVLLSIIKFFHLGPGHGRKLVIIAFSILSFSFLITSMLVMWNENLFNRILYTGASAWLGSFLYVLMAVVLAWLLFGIVKIFGVKIDPAYIATPFLVAAVIFSAYGIWNAAHPVLKNISVKISGLPEQWRVRTIVHVTDIHLGAIRRSGFCSKVVDLINSAKPDLVLMTGDLFDGGGRDLRDLCWPLDKIQSQFGTYFVTGNHEGYVGLQRCFDAIASTPMIVLRDSVAVVDGLQIVGIDYPTSREPKNLNALFAQVDSTKPSVVLFHSPDYVDTMRQIGVDLQLAGHTHRGQQWPFNYITRAVYKGLDYGQFTFGDFTLYTSCGAGTWGPPLRTGNRPEVVAIKLE